MYGMNRGYGQADENGIVPSNAKTIEELPAVGNRLTPPAVEQLIRDTRSAEQWERYDSVVVGPGARETSKGWFNSWSELAAADRIVFFNGRDSNVGAAYTNQTSERADWAQLIQQAMVEFIPVPGFSDLESDPNDGQSMPILFQQQLTNMMSFRFTLSDSDEIALAPGSHFPAGVGASGGSVDGSASPVGIGGSNGLPYNKNSWQWPHPIGLAAKSKITISGRIDNPFKAMLQNVTGPGTKSLPKLGGGFAELPNWYIIRVTLRGPRFLQLRAARSA
jgi:hypothetical protein